MKAGLHLSSACVPPQVMIFVSFSPPALPLGSEEVVQACVHL